MNKNRSKLEKLYRYNRFLIFASIVFTIIAFMFLSAESLPYQDATAEMIEEQMRNIRFYSNLFRLGEFIFICSMIFSTFCKWKFEKQKYLLTKEEK